MMYEEALNNYKKAKAAHEKTGEKLTASINSLEVAKSEIEIECKSCHKTTRTKDIELIVRKSGGYYSFSDDEHHYSTWTVWVCPHCTEPQYPPSETKGPFAKEYTFSHGFDHYVKDIHEWYSDRECCHGRVLHLLGPHLKREEERRAREDRERKILEAKKLLAQEGILGNS